MFKKIVFFIAFYVISIQASESSQEFYRNMCMSIALINSRASFEHNGQNENYTSLSIREHNCQSARYLSRKALRNATRILIAQSSTIYTENINTAQSLLQKSKLSSVQKEEQIPFCNYYEFKQIMHDFTNEHKDIFLSDKQTVISTAEELWFAHSINLFYKAHKGLKPKAIQDNNLLENKCFKALTGYSPTR